MENIVSYCDLTIECQEADYQGNYRISSLLSKLSDLATKNAVEVGIWRPELGERFGFVLAKETLGRCTGSQPESTGTCHSGE